MLCLRLFTLPFGIIGRLSSVTVLFEHILCIKYTFITNNPLYTDTRYNDKIRYDDNLTVTKPSLKRSQLVTNYARILYLILLRNICFGCLLESPH